jgi:hypothetical protein
MRPMAYPTLKKLTAPCAPAPAQPLTSPPLRRTPPKYHEVLVLRGALGHVDEEVVEEVHVPVGNGHRAVAAAARDPGAPAARGQVGGAAAWQVSVPVAGAGAEQKLGHVAALADPAAAEQAWGGAGVGVGRGGCGAGRVREGESLSPSRRAFSLMALSKRALIKGVQNSFPPAPPSVLALWPPLSAAGPPPALRARPAHLYTVLYAMSTLLPPATPRPAPKDL